MENAGNIIIKLKKMDATVTRLGHIAALLEWDQETYMPEAAVKERASQLAMMVGLHHEKIIDGEWDSLFSEIGYKGKDIPAGIDKVDAAFLRESWKRWKKKIKVPRVLVENIARETSLSQAAWAGARKATCG